MIFSTLRFLSENKGGWALPDSATLTGLPSLRRGEIGSADRCTAPPPGEAVARLKQKRLVTQRAVNQDRRNNPGRGGNQHIVAINIGPVLPARRCR